MSVPHLILAGRVLGQDGWISPGALIVEEGRIAFIGSPDHVGTQPAQMTDLRPLQLVPGFIDVHIHGWGGVRIESGAQARQVASDMARNGTTSFLPTLVGAPDFASLLARLEDTAAASGTTAGAEILGVHLEGPFLNPDPAVRGAQLPEYMRVPSLADLRALHDRSHGRLLYMTIAPELPGALEVIREATRLGIITGAAHSAASYEETLEALAAGLKTTVHTFNGMKPMHHRAPGLVGAALTQEGLMTEIIADGVHVAPAAVALLVRCKGVHSVILVTDSVQFAGLPDGRYERDGGRTVLKMGDRCSLDQGGALAGSVVGMYRDVLNATRFAGLDLADGVRMASANPARLLGLAHSKGTLAPGWDADVVALDDHGSVVWTMVRGLVVVDTARR
ncbi:MAG: N-acetylglucosamine-6-phosphate deacetylase [Armatimonadota bacterium]|nr:N-acetylglucosamine-6-phosphate deacetylase [Armatimonadota bacterium]